MSELRDNPLLGLFGYQLRRASAFSMEELGRDLAAIELRPVEASILILIGANPRTKLVDVGRELGVQRANMTPLITSLETRNLVKREATDGRSQGLLLTNAGANAHDQALAILRSHDARLLDKLGSNVAVSVVVAMVEKIWQNRKTIGASPERKDMEG